MKTNPIVVSVLLVGMLIAAAIAWSGKLQAEAESLPQFFGQVGEGTFSIVYPAKREIHRCTMKNDFDVICTPLEFTIDKQ